jgi:hypothetical protein
MRGSGWDFILNVAEAYGWKKAGTEPPKGLNHAQWSGAYDTSDGQRVTASDAVALAAALRLASADPRRADVEARVSREQTEAVRAILLREHGITLPPGEEVEHSIDPTFLEEVILFCERGAFHVE